MNEFTDAVVLVTGAGRGIGRAIALAFARAGGRLAVNDLTPVNLDETVRQIRAGGGQVRDYLFDIAKKLPVQGLVAQVLSDFGRIDILVNNAGVYPMVPLLDMDEWDFIRTLEVNLCGAFFTSQQVGRAMRAQGGGVILNIAAAFGPSGGPEESAAFIASKQGLIGLTRAAARELSPYNIRVNAICPGWTETEGVLSSSKAQNLMRTAAQALPQNRPGQADQVAELALFLAGDRAAQITGQVVEVEGRLAMD